MLRPHELTIVISDQRIDVVHRHSESSRVTRIYPCPVLHSYHLINVITSTIDANWELDGGVDVAYIIDNEQQSLIVVSTSYQAHLQLEKLLERLNEASGVGYRTDANHCQDWETVFVRGSIIGLRELIHTRRTIMECQVVPGATVARAGQGWVAECFEGIAKTKSR